MNFPPTNKINQNEPDINQRFGENITLIEEKLKQVSWWYFVILYFAALGIVLTSIFALIVTVKAAMIVF